MIKPHPLCISRTRKRLFWVRANADDTSRAQKGLFGVQTYANDVSCAHKRPFPARPTALDAFRTTKTGFPARTLRYETRLLFRLGLHVGFEELLLDIARHRLVVSEVHSECSTA